MDAAVLENYSGTFPGSARAAKFAPEASHETVAGFLTRWLASKKKHLSSSTYEGYPKLVEHRLVPALGTHMIVDLKRKMIKDWLDTLEIGNKTLSNIQSCLRSAMTEAVDEELIENSPMAGWTYKHKAAPVEEDEVDPFSPEVQRAIIAAMTGQAANLVQFALWTGLRTSELVALDWGNVDLIRGEVMITKAMTQASKGAAEIPKTAAGRRTVKLLGPAMAALKAQKDHTFFLAGKVFQNPRTLERWAGDGPIRKAMWAHAVKKAGVRYRRPYQTRHTYASILLSAGEHPMWVAQQMGHSDWTMIARVYGRWMPSADVNAGGKAESLWNPQGSRHDEKQATILRVQKRSK